MHGEGWRSSLTDRCMLCLLLPVVAGVVEWSPCVGGRPGHSSYTQDLLATTPRLSSPSLTVERERELRLHFMDDDSLSAVTMGGETGFGGAGSFWDGAG